MGLSPASSRSSGTVVNRWIAHALGIVAQSARLEGCRNENLESTESADATEVDEELVAELRSSLAEELGTEAKSSSYYIRALRLPLQTLMCTLLLGRIRLHRLVLCGKFLQLAFSLLLGCRALWMRHWLVRLVTPLRMSVSAPILRTGIIVTRATSS
eukprot:4599884-Amphidinium_carterae.1